MSKELYVGWSDQTPSNYRRAGRLFFAGTMLSFLLLGTLYVTNQRGFIGSYYEFGTLQEVSGHLISEPVWGLRTVEDGVVKTIPVVGFGKFGPEETISRMMETHQLEEGTMVTLRGMLFHYRDRTWMELTEMENSLVQSSDTRMLDRTIRTLGNKTYQGEIVDPKCFFGVMNPATKAVHRSCAIRCISGGVPPILALREDGEFVDYLFLVDEGMTNLQEEVLPYVGIPVELSGTEMVYDDWKVLKVDGTQFRPKLMVDLGMQRCDAGKEQASL